MQDYLLLLFSRLKYTINILGSSVDVWTGAFCCPGEKVAVMVCLVLRGYHSVAKYKWYCAGNVLPCETHPIVYLEVCGDYKCVIDVNGDIQEYSFIVYGRFANIHRSASLVYFFLQ